jgi:hypothetical protein
MRSSLKLPDVNAVSRLRHMTLQDLLLVLRMSLWAVLVPVLKRVVPLPKVARMMWADRHARGRGSERQQRIVRAARSILRARPLSRDENCLDRSLVLYRFLSMEMLDPRLVLGVRCGPEGVEGHAWVTVDGRPVVEASVADFAPIAVIGPAGAVNVVGGDGRHDALASFGVRG